MPNPLNDVEVEEGEGRLGAPKLKDWKSCLGGAEAALDVDQKDAGSMVGADGDPPERSWTAEEWARLDPPLAREVLAPAAAGGEEAVADGAKEKEMGALKVSGGGVPSAGGGGADGRVQLGVGEACGVVVKVKAGEGVKESGVGLLERAVAGLIEVGAGAGGGGGRRGLGSRPAVMAPRAKARLRSTMSLVVLAFDVDSSAAWLNRGVFLTLSREDLRPASRLSASSARLAVSTASGLTTTDLDLTLGEARKTLELSESSAVGMEGER